MSDSTLRRKANRIGYVLKKGYVRTKSIPSIIHEKVSGYTIYGTVDNRKDLFFVYGDSELYFNLLSEDDVERFLREEYEARNLVF